MGLPSCTDTEGTARVARGYRQPIVLSSVDRHGNEDRGLAIINALVAVEEGADRIQGTAFGIGERCGNAAIEVLPVNCKRMGYIEQDLVELDEYCRFVSRVCHLPMPPTP